MTYDIALYSALETAPLRFHPDHRDAVRETFHGGRYEPISEGLVRYFAEQVIPLPPVTATSMERLPAEIVRKCCRYKSCGNTVLRLQVHERFEHVKRDLYRKVKATASYVRASNDDVYFHGTLTELLAGLNDPTNFPVVDGIYDQGIEPWSEEL